MSLWKELYASNSMNRGKVEGATCAC